MEQRILQNAKQIVAGVKRASAAHRNNQNFCFREQKESTHNLFISSVSRYRSTNYESYVDAPIAVVFGLFSISFVQISRLLLIILIDNQSFRPNA